MAEGEDFGNEDYALENDDDDDDYGNDTTPFVPEISSTPAAYG